MRLLFYILLCFPLFFANGCVSSKQSSSSSISQRSTSDLQEKLLSKNFDFKASRALPMGYPMVDLVGSNYSVIFEKDMIKSFLPFFGTITSGPSFGRSKGMKFESEPETFVVLKTQNGFQVDARVKTREDVFLLSMYVRESGYATLSITTKTRSTITYEGEIR